MSNPCYFDPIPGADSLDLQTCVEQYKSSRNQNLIGLILYQLRGTINHYLYNKTNYPDKSELLALYEDKLLECLESYDTSKGTTFRTYYSRCVNNALINFIQTTSSRAKVLSLDYNYDSNEDGETDLKSTLKTEDMDLTDSDTLMLLEQLRDKLDDNEYRVCKVILNENHRLQYTEIGAELGLTVSGVKGILKRLEKKFDSKNYAENCVVPL